jgi:hypothetical protein
MVKTNQLLKSIKETKTEALEDLMKQIPNLNFCEFMDHIIESKHTTKGKVIALTNIQRNYGYQIFDGTRKPNKDKVIQLCLALGLDLHLTNNVLALSDNGALYPKVKRDAMLIYCIEHHKTVYETNELLMEYELDILE